LLSQEKNEMFSSKKVPHSLNNLRIDIILKELCLVDSRNKALAVIMAGNVFVDEKRINKPGKLVKSNSIVKLKNNDHNWASRGGIKLDNSLKFFKTEVSGKICLDIGCSSGGFTDVLIFYGAKRVYAVDVGYGQFDWRLRNSKKVKLFERTNAKNLNKQIISEPIDLVVCDVSFISIRKIFGNIKGLLNEKYEILSLIKPQLKQR